MTLLAGLDLNASRARAVIGPAGANATPTALDSESGLELPLALSLEGRRVAVGAAGIQLCRQFPHLSCRNFLPHLAGERRWHAGRHHLSAEQALGHVFQHVHASLSNAGGIALVLPSYLRPPQRKGVGDLAKQAKLPLLGTVAAPLAAAWAMRGHRPWHGSAILLDVDEYALTATAVAVAEPPAPSELRVVGEQVVPGLGSHAWKEQLLDGIADRCIRQSRRDPRANGGTEQALYDQFDTALEACRQNRLVELVIQSDNWYQDLMLKPTELEQYCAALAPQALAAVRRLLAGGQPPALLGVTTAVARLPGLLRAVHGSMGGRTPPVILDPGAMARVAHELAGQWFTGALARGPLDTAIPVKHAPRAAARPPARTPAPNQPTRLPPRKSGVEKALRADDDFSVGIDE